MRLHRAVAAGAVVVLGACTAAGGAVTRHDAGRTPRTTAVTPARPPATASPPATTPATGVAPTTTTIVPVAVGPVDAQVPDATASTTTTTTTTIPLGRGIPLDPAWPATITVLTDSVVLGAERALLEGFPGWQVEVLGQPALMVKHAARDLLPNGRLVGSVVVVGLGYNSLWEPDRANFDRRAERFDAEAEALLAELWARGARKVVWVTLREATPENVPANWQKQHRKYSWYFPYVNERLWALAERHPEIAVADWAAVSNRSDITYDAMHLNPAGARLMLEVIRGAVGA